MSDTANTAQHAPTHAGSATGHFSGRSRHIVLLDLIRFAAALLVLVYHDAFHSFGERAGWHTVLAPYASVGWIGVPVFFVLSGFVIAFSAEKATPSAFVKSRVLRLYPAVWICSTFAFALLWFERGVSKPLLHAWLNALTLFPLGPIIDGSYWTLRVEMSFYACIFLLLLFGCFRVIGQLVALLSAVSSVFLFTGLAIDHGWWHPNNAARGIPDFLLNSRWARLFLIDHAPHFATGVLLWLILTHGSTLFRGVALALSLLGAVLSIRLEGIEAVGSTQAPHLLLPSLFLWAAGILAIVLSVNYNDQILPALGPAWATRLRTMGLVTYPLYLLHQDIGAFFIHRFAGKVPDSVIIGVSAAVAILLAYLVVRFAEKPLRQMLNRQLHSQSPTTPAATLP